MRTREASVNWVCWERPEFKCKLKTKKAKSANIQNHRNCCTVSWCCSNKKRYKIKGTHHWLRISARQLKITEKQANNNKKRGKMGKKEALAEVRSSVTNQIFLTVDHFSCQTLRKQCKIYSHMRLLIILLHFFNVRENKVFIL